MAKKAELKGKLSLSGAAYEAGLKRATAQAKNFAKEVGSNLSGFITQPLKAIGVAAAGFLTYETFKAGIEGSIEMGASLEKMSKRTGTAVSSLYELRRTFKANDVDADNLGATINKMQRSLANGSAAFSELGLSISALKTQAPDAQFNAIARAIGSLPDPAERAAKAMQIFGRSGGELLPIFENLESLGNGISYKAAVFQATAKEFEEISVAFKQAAANLQGVFLGIAAQAKDQILYIANVLKSPDFLSIGLKVGNYFKQGLNIFIAAASHPMVFIEMIKNGLITAFLTGLNYLAAGIKTVRLYFQDGFLETIQGLGMIIESVFVKAFAVPIAYFQAGIDAVLFKLPKSLGGSGESESAQKEAQEHQYKAQGAIIAAKESEKVGDNKSAAEFKAEAKSQLEAMRDAQKRAQGESIEARAERYMGGGGPKIQTPDGEKTADQLYKVGMETLKYGLNRAGAAIKASPVQDIFNAGEYSAKTKAGANYLADQGARESYQGGSSAAQRRRDNGGLNFNTLLGVFGRAKALEMTGQLPDKHVMSAAAQANYINAHGRAAFDDMMQKGEPQYDAHSSQVQSIASNVASNLQRRVGGSMVMDFNTGPMADHLAGKTRDYLGTGGDQAYHQIRRGDAARAKQQALSDLQKSKNEDKLGQPGVLDRIAQAVEAG